MREIRIQRRKPVPPPPDPVESDESYIVIMSPDATWTTIIKARDIIKVSLNGVRYAATDLHRPTRRLVVDWVAEDEVLLGETVSQLENEGIQVTPWTR